jgi:outer membrane protein assembly factor BamA
MRGFRIFFCFLVFLFAAHIAIAQFPLLDISVSGNSRFASADVIAASGLHLGQSASSAEFDAAVTRLMDTGMFRSANYRYDPKSSGGKTGYALTLLVGEDSQTGGVLLDFPGVDSTAFWGELRKSNSLINSEMPANSRAEAYYRTAIESALKLRGQPQAVVSRSEGALGGRGIVTVFRPANLPRISEVQFAGNQAISAKTLHDALDRVTVGEEFTERSFSQRVELNLRPLYEDKALLAVRFGTPSMATNPAGEVAVTVAVEEGPPWKLGKVTIQGDPQAEDLYRAGRFPEGKLATSLAMNTAVNDMQNFLKKDGYIAVRSKVKRSFHAENTTVDLGIDVARGPQFTFGELQINGLPDSLRAELSSQCKIASGAPYDQPYLEDYLRSAVKFMGNRIQGISQEMRPRQGTRVIDLILVFKQ